MNRTATFRVSTAGFSVITEPKRKVNLEVRFRRDACVLNGPEGRPRFGVFRRRTHTYVHLGSLCIHWWKL